MLQSNVLSAKKATIPFLEFDFGLYHLFAT